MQLRTALNGAVDFTKEDICDFLESLNPAQAGEDGGAAAQEDDQHKVLIRQFWDQMSDIGYNPAMLTSSLHYTGQAVLRVAVQALEAQGVMREEIVAHIAQ